MGKVAARWGLPEKTPFYGIPNMTLAWMGQNVTPSEERVLHRLLVGWKWANGDRFQDISIRRLAEVCGMDRRSVRRAIRDLVDRCILVEELPDSRGQKSRLSIRPLVLLVAGSEVGAQMHHSGLSKGGRKGGGTSTRPPVVHPCAHPGGESGRTREAAVGDKIPREDVLERGREDEAALTASSRPLRRLPEHERRRLLQAQLDQMAAEEVSARQNGRAGGG